MIYTDLVVIILGVSLVFYVILGGADFGAGIIELFTGDKGNSTISKAMAPVWEANHIWLILALVILFNGFPKAYAIFSTALHIPIMLFLIGIIFRGAAFTFRHYDAFKDGSENFYSNVFRYSSIWTVFFLGVTIAAIIGGTIPAENTSSFYDYFMAPWLNPFCFSVGIFMTILSAYIAGIFLLGEVETDEGYQTLEKFSIRLFIAALFSGVAIFLTSHYYDHELHQRFFAHPVSVAALIGASLVVPYIFILIKKKKIWLLRLIVGGQILLILGGWFVLQWPNLMHFTNGAALSFYEAAAPELVMKVLLGALLFGIVLIFPALYYLFWVFKRKNH